MICQVNKSTKKLKLSLPFQSVIFADNQYAIFDDMKAFQRASNAREGLNLEHLKVALKVRCRHKNDWFVCLFRRNDVIFFAVDGCASCTELRVL